MKFRITFFALLFVLACDLPAQTSDAIPIAVLNVAGPRRTLANNIVSLLTVNLSAAPGLVLVDRNQLNKVLEEQALGRSGLISTETAAKIGRLTGAKILITGREFKSNEGELVIIANVIGSENARVFSHTVQGPQTNLVGLISELSQKIVQTVNDQLNNLLSAAPSVPDVATNAIETDLKRKRLSSILIRLEEQNRDERRASQIAAAELRTVLQRAGFGIVDEKSTRLPDLLLTGDAITSPMLRNGDMLSCQATVQLKVRDRSSGEILSLEQGQASATELNEGETAAKALKTAVQKVSERLLPILASRLK